MIEKIEISHIFHLFIQIFIFQVPQWFSISMELNYGVFEVRDVKPCMCISKNSKQVKIFDPFGNYSNFILLYNVFRFEKQGTNKSYEKFTLKRSLKCLKEFHKMESL